MQDDGGGTNTSAPETFTITVLAINDPPTLDVIASPLNINEDAPLQTVNLSGIGTGAASEIQPLIVTASSSNPAVVPNPTVTYTSPSATGTLSFTPVANAFGSALITVTVSDDGPLWNTVQRTFTVNVASVNDLPTLDAIGAVNINEDAPLQTVSLSGIGTGAANETQPLTVTASSDNTAVVPNPTVTYTSPGATGTLGFTPVANAFGSATITVTVSDGSGMFLRTFTVNVASVNDLPVAQFSAGPDFRNRPSFSDFHGQLDRH